MKWAFRYITPRPITGSGILKIISFITDISFFYCENTQCAEKDVFKWLYKARSSGHACNPHAWEAEAGAQ